eukprot:3265518-Pyramimonas_sp.AAC.1
MMTMMMLMMMMMMMMMMMEVEEVDEAEEDGGGWQRPQRAAPGPLGQSWRPLEPLWRRLGPSRVRPAVRFPCAVWGRDPGGLWGRLGASELENATAPKAICKSLSSASMGPLGMHLGGLLG